MSESAPSIGSIGSIAVDEFNDRSKGFLPQVNNDVVGLDTLLRQVAREHTFGSRLNVRTFLGHGALHEGANLRDLQARFGALPAPAFWNGALIQCEVLIPVRDHPTVSHIVYCGANTPERGRDDDAAARERDLLRHVAELPRKPPRGDLQIELLSARPGDRDVADILAIYRDRYTSYLAPFTDASVRNMAEGCQVVVVRDGDERIASVCVAEIAHIPVPGASPVHLVEISDAATRRDCERQGMYTAAKAASIRFLRQANPDAIITTEARANSIGVLRSNFNLGMNVVGTEPLQCVISSKSNEDVPQRTKHATLIVFCYPW